MVSKWLSSSSPIKCPVTPYKFLPPSQKYRISLPPPPPQPLKGCYLNWQCFQALIQTFYASGNRTLLPFVKIWQSFILVKTLRRRIEQGWRNCWCLFFKKVSFWQIPNTALIFQIRPWFPKLIWQSQNTFCDIKVL